MLHDAHYIANRGTVRLMKQFKYSRTDYELTLDGETVHSIDGDEFVAPLELVSEASLSSLRRAMMYAQEEPTVTESSDPSDTDLKYRGLDYRSLPANCGRLQVSPSRTEEFSEDYSPVLESSVSVMPDGSSVVDVEVEVSGLELDEDEYAPILRPLLDRLNASFVDSVLLGEGTQGLLILRVSYGPRGATVGDAIEVGQLIAMFVKGLRDGRLTPDTVLGMLAAGRGNLLIGQLESDWLEVKSQGYDLAVGDAPKIELAQDVARFANGTVDAVLLVGFKTTRDRQMGGEAISKITASPITFNSGQYHQVIDRRVFPPILGLAVETYETPLKGGSQGYLLAIRIPAQPEESKPFLVHGAIVGGKVEGAFISIVQRRGEHSIPTTGPSIHATLAAGRALLRGRIVLPTD